jgi:hypothetical protein
LPRGRAGISAKKYTPLVRRLDDWLEQPFRAIPPDLRECIEDALFPFQWDQLTCDQRRLLIIQEDERHDPRLDLERQAGFDRGVKRQDLRRQIDIWTSVPVTSATEVSLKEQRLKELNAELRRLEPRAARKSSVIRLPAGYVAYPKAAAVLAERLAATSEEIAAWIWFTHQNGGLAAYRNANELIPPPRFFYDVMLHPTGDYLAPLMGCWFDEAEINSFLPTERFVTGAALIQRWTSRVANARAFIEAKIAESRLIAFHPIYGSTREMACDEDFPPMDTGLFAQSEVERIESEDFPGDARPQPGIVGSPEWRRAVGQKGANAKHNKPGGSREKRAAIRAVWASGKYSTRDRCAEEESRALDMSFSAARKALAGAPDPKRD